MNSLLADIWSQSEFRTQRKSQRKTNANTEMTQCLPLYGSARSRHSTYRPFGFRSVYFYEIFMPGLARPVHCRPLTGTRSVWCRDVHSNCSTMAGGQYHAHRELTSQNMLTPHDACQIRQSGRGEKNTVR